MCVFHFRALPGDWLLFGWSSAFLLLWTLAPRDCVTYYQARRLSGHTLPCGECVCFNLEDSVPLSCGRTLSGHTWSTLRKFFILNLSSLHPSSKPHLGKLVLGQTVKLVGYGPQLLDDSLWWSDHEFGCSVLFAPAQTSSRWCCTADTRCSGTSYGGMTLDTHGRIHGLCYQGWSSPQDEDLRCTVLLSMYRKTSRAIS